MNLYLFPVIGIMRILVSDAPIWLYILIIPRVIFSIQMPGPHLPPTESKSRRVWSSVICISEGLLGNSYMGSRRRPRWRAAPLNRIISYWGWECSEALDWSCVLVSTYGKQKCKLYFWTFQVLPKHRSFDSRTIYIQHTRAHIPTSIPKEDSLLSETKFHNMRLTLTGFLSFFFFSSFFMKGKKNKGRKQKWRDNTT